MIKIKIDNQIIKFNEKKKKTLLDPQTKTTKVASPNCQIGSLTLQSLLA